MGGRKPNSGPHISLQLPEFGLFSLIKVGVQMVSSQFH